MAVTYNLIYDRTAEDLAQKTDKAYYNYTDLNRVQEAADYLSSRLANFGYSASLNALPTWTENDIPTVPQMEQYLENIVTLKETISLPPDTPELPASIQKLTYQGANDIERLLFILEQTINQLLSSFARSGEWSFWCGTRPFPCAESYMGRTWEELDAMNTRWENWQVANWYLLLYGNLEAEGVVE